MFSSPETSRPALGLTQPLIRWVPTYFPELKLLGHEVKQQRPSGTEVKNEWSFTSIRRRRKLYVLLTFIIIRFPYFTAVQLVLKTARSSRSSTSYSFFCQKLPDCEVCISIIAFGIRIYRTWRRLSNSKRMCNLFGSVMFPCHSTNAISKPGHCQYTLEIRRNTQLAVSKKCHMLHILRLPRNQTKPVCWYRMSL